MSNVQQGMSNVQVWRCPWHHECPKLPAASITFQGQRQLGHWTFLVGHWIFLLVYAKHLGAYALICFDRNLIHTLGIQGFGRNFIVVFASFNRDFLFENDPSQGI